MRIGKAAKALSVATAIIDMVQTNEEGPEHRIITLKELEDLRNLIKKAQDAIRKEK